MQMNQPENHLLLGHVTPEKEYDAFNGFKTIFFTIGLVFGGALLISIGIPVFIFVVVILKMNQIMHMY